MSFKGLIKAFGFVLMAIAILGFVSCCWYLDHVRFVL